MIRIIPPQNNRQIISDHFYQQQQVPTKQPQTPTFHRNKYQKVHGFNHRPSFLQVSGILLFFTIMILHSVLVKQIGSIGHPILIVMCVFFYVLGVAVGIDYMRLALSDPVDPRVCNQYYQQTQRDINLLVFCQKCKVNVHKYSYHCNKCKRCVEQFDHHCKFVNNCVGKPNYMFFFRLLMYLILYLIVAMGQSIWIAIQSSNTFRWIAVVLGALSFALLLPNLYLALFHCYISFFKYGTTLKYLRGQDEEQRVSKKTSKKQSKDKVESTATDRIKQCQIVVVGGRKQSYDTDNIDEEQDKGTGNVLKKQCLY